MTQFEIRDSSIKEGRKDKLVGILYYYERSKRFYAEIPAGITEWECPMMFMKHVREGVLTIDHISVKKWVEQRIIPHERQNIGAILRDNGLKEYDEYRLLMLSEGRGAMDDEYIRKIPFDLVPEEIRAREKRRVRDVMAIAGGKVVVFFADGRSGMVDPRELVPAGSPTSFFLGDEERMRHVKVSPGGHGIEWGSDHFIMAEKLYTHSETLPVCYEDVLEFASDRLISTRRLTRELGASRQYISQLVNEGRLSPVIDEPSVRLYPRAQIERDQSGGFVDKKAHNS